MDTIKRILDLIDTAGITKNKLLKDLGLNKNSFVNWIDRGNVPSGDVLALIADYFHVTTDYLLGRTDIKGASPSSDELAPLLQKPLMKEIYDAAMQLSPENRRIILAQIEAVKALEEDAKK